MIIKDKNKSVANLIKNYDFQKIEGDNLSQKESPFKNTFSQPVNSSEINNERSLAKQNDFSISPIVSQHRGIKNQEQEEYEKQIQNIVKEKLLLVEDEWKKKGHDEGLEQGKNELVEQSKNVINHYMDELIEIINSIKNVKKVIINEQKNQLIEIIKNVTKWIILKELKTDDDYIIRLFEKLLYELDTKENLLVKVSANHIQHLKESMPVILEKFSELKNVRLEVVNESITPGIVIESAFGIIDGNFEFQFENIDKMFSQLQDNNV